MSKVFKKGVGFIASVLGLLFLTSPFNVFGEKNGNQTGTTCKNPKLVIRMATPFNPGHILADFAFKFEELVEQESRGTIDVRVAAGFASEEVVNQLTSSGFVDMQATGGEPLEEFAPQYFFFNAPFVIKDYDHFVRVWGGPLGDEAKQLIAQNGNMYSLATVFRGQRQTTSHIPVNGPADIVGLKLRLPVVSTWIAVWEALGAKPVPVPLTDLYNALATGAADASEGDLSQISSFKLDEVQDYLAITNHLVAVGWIMVNKCFFEQLSWPARQIVLYAAEQASQFATQKMLTNETTLLNQLQSLGMNVTKPDAAAIRDTAKPAIEQLFATEWPVTTWEEVLAQ
jgi:tripartite ATP-independent transporter DctP family solute receptor